MPLAIKINPKDNVVVALHPIAKGTAVPVETPPSPPWRISPRAIKWPSPPFRKGRA